MRRGGAGVITIVAVDVDIPVQLCTQCLNALMSVECGYTRNIVNLSGFLLATFSIKSIHHLRQ